MNFKITRQNLHNGLAGVSASIPSKTTLPVLSNVLFEAREDGVWISGTDLDVSVRVKILAEVTEIGSLTAPGKKLQEITRELPDQTVEVTTTGEQIELQCGRSHFKLNGLPADDFPKLPVVDFSEALKISGQDLNGLIQHTSFAVSTEESRPILNGVLWELRDGEMNMVATNGHHLARMGIKVEATGASPQDLIVPPAALAQVQRLFEDDSAIEVARGDNYLGFRAVSTEVYTRLVEGTYPNYDQVIPRDNDKTATVEKKTLESAVKRMAVVASDQTHRIRMKFEPGRVELSVLTPDLGEGQDELEIGYDGEELEIGFNANYLLEILRYMPTDEVNFSFAAPERAATMEPIGEDVPDYLCLVMPLRLLD